MGFFLYFDVCKSVGSDERNGNYVFQVEASNENIDFQDQIVLQSALIKSKDNFLKNGVISYDHLHRRKDEDGNVVSDPSMIIGEPIDVWTEGDKTFVKGMLYKANEKAQEVVKLLKSGSTRIRASVGGMFPKTTRGEDGVERIVSVLWNDLALTPCPVNNTVGAASFAKSFTPSAFARVLSAGGSADSGSWSPDESGVLQLFEQEICGRQLMSYFSGVQSAGSESETAALEKALSAGYGTDHATFINGRAMIPEDLEATTINVTSMMENDCKMFNSLKKEPAHSTIHEYNRRTAHGAHRFLSVPEGGAGRETDQELSRRFVEIKYLQTLRQVTRQMEVVKTFEDALASEKIAGIQTIVKGAEHQIFHGDSRVIPTEFDGLLSILDRPGSGAVKRDLRGKSLGTVGEQLFDDVAQEVFDIDNNGELTRALFPPVLAGDIKGLFADRLRMLMGDTASSFTGLPPYGTAIGHDIRFSDKDAGADKYFHVKGVVKAAGDPLRRPAAPQSVAAANGAKAGSKFVTEDAGTYMYTVHAVNAFGISEGKALAAPATVTAGDGVTLTITPASSGNTATGYIICRSAKDGKEGAVTMEMVSVMANPSGDTEFIDLNEDLPGTASMLFLSDGMYGSPTMQFDQLLPVQSIPMFPTDRAVTPFLIVLYGALQVNAPEYCAIVKNIQYSRGL